MNPLCYKQLYKRSLCLLREARGFNKKSSMPFVIGYVGFASGLRSYSCSLAQRFSGQINAVKHNGLFYLSLNSTVKTNSTSGPYSVFMCFGRISEQIAIIYLNSANWSGFRRFRKKKSRKIINFAMSVRPPARMQQLGSHWTDFHENWYEYFPKICAENSEFIQIDTDNRYFTSTRI